jgi:hypothetical protein
MLVEVCLRPRSLLVGAAALASLGVLGARENPVLLGSNEPRIDVEDCGALGADNGTTSASRLVAEDLGESLAPSTVVTVADVVAQVVNPSAQPVAAVAAVGSPTVPVASLQSFIASPEAATGGTSNLILTALACIAS